MAGGIFELRPSFPIKTAPQTRSSDIFSPFYDFRLLLGVIVVSLYPAMEENMVKTETIRARISPRLKSSAEGILESLGLNASQAITIFYRQIELHGGLPFEVTLPTPNAVTRKSIEETENGDGLTVCKNAEDMFNQLGVSSHSKKPTR